ncbi:MAG: hypothetical protein O2968_10130, partial [Acidobacteria bacterium]|nr:hypothetical protein [Acidobacteriota bacterium]
SCGRRCEIQLARRWPPRCFSPPENRVFCHRLIGPSIAWLRWLVILVILGGLCQYAGNAKRRVLQRLRGWYGLVFHAVRLAAR